MIRLPRAMSHRFRNSGGGDDSPGSTGQHPEEETQLVRAINVTTDTLVASHVEWAGTSQARRRGLLGRDHLEPNQGMYIVPTQWIHMFGMRFPIDVAFLDGDGRVLWIHHVLKPNRLSRLVWRAEGALELAPGTLARSGTEVGHVIELE